MMDITYNLSEVMVLSRGQSNQTNEIGGMRHVELWTPNLIFLKYYLYALLKA